MISALLLAAAAPQPGELKTFADWTVGCDNGRACQAVALLSEDSSDGATLAISRGPEADAVPIIWVTVRVEGVPSLEALQIDGRRFPLALDRNSETLRVRDSLAAAGLLGQATSIVAVGQRGDGRIPVSAKGSAAALLYMDTAQRRLGTTGALVRRGPAARVPPPPALPVIAASAVSHKGPRRLSDATLRRLLGRDATRCEYSQKMFVETARLDARHSLALASHPCGNGAYNLSYSAFIVNERGGAAPARFDDRAGAQGSGALVNAGWDAAARRLGTFAKGRGLGDCGVGEDYAWDGAMFRLISQRVMRECRGSTSYITTWRAEVR